MSLFGTSPDDSTLNPQTRSIFGEDSTHANTSTSSLFNDNTTNESPWSMPTPKRAARQSLVKQLLPATDVPESYIDAYDSILNSGESTGAGVSLTATKNVLQNSGLAAAAQDKILNLVIPNGSEFNGLGRPEFNVLLALIGLGQEGDDITLDGVDERRKKLPPLKNEYLDKVRKQSQVPVTPTKHVPATPTTIKHVQKPQQDSFGEDPSSDPWASSPKASRLSTQAYGSDTMKASGREDHLSSMSNGFSKSADPFSSSSGQPANSSHTNTSQGAGGDAEGWNTYNTSNGPGFPVQSDLGGFGDGGRDNLPNRPGHNPPGSQGASVVIPPGTDEAVTVTTLPEKEGMFLFQHRNYEVKTIRRGSTVVRRYSDFVWLLDCLQKRYPFRRLPLLPPKRVQVNGNHLAADSGSFLEKRRRGLVRFTNALVQHPILSQETLVIMFLTVPTELSVWRKQAQISVQEEFTGKPLPPDLEDTLPPTLPDLFEQVRAGVRRSSEIYINLCNLMERLAKRSEGLAADNLRFSLALSTLVESTNDLYAVDTNDVPLLNEGIQSTAKHLSTSQTLLEDEARAWESGVLEDLKSLRDSMVSMRDVFDRRDRLAKNNIPQLEKRIETSENKLHALRSKPAAQVKAGEMEKVESSIIADKESIVQQHARGVFIRECVRDEIVTFQRTIYSTTRLHKDWSEERVKYSELQANNWRTLADQLESMPSGES